MSDQPAPSGTVPPPDQFRQLPRRRSPLRRALPLGAAIAVIAIGAVVILGVIGWRYGLEALLIGLAAAIVPVPVLVLAFFWLDRYEPEPARYLVFCFAWGAFVATSLALAVNTGFAYLFTGIGLPEDLVAVVVAPVIEEIGKVAAPLLLLWRRRRLITGFTDGLVYCGLSATGFAMVENILYLGGIGYHAGSEEFGPATGLVNLIAIFIMRVFVSGFAHPLFTAAAGIGLGVAVRTSSTAVRWLAPLLGLFVAMLLHAAWNLMAVLAGTTAGIWPFVIGYVAVMVPIFLAMVGLAIWLRAWEGQLTQRTLPVYVRAGWLSPPEVAALRSLGTRHSARRWARRVAGEAGLRAMREFQYAATRLALLRDRIERGVDSTAEQRARSTTDEQELLAEISTLRQAYTGRDPVVPPARWDGRRYTIMFPDGVARTVAAPLEPVMPLPVPMSAAQVPGLPPAYPSSGPAPYLGQGGPHQAGPHQGQAGPYQPPRMPNQGPGGPYQGPPPYPPYR